jgi:small subunit ribosomal protein S1
MTEEIKNNDLNEENENVQNEETNSEQPENQEVKKEEPIEEIKDEEPAEEEVKKEEPIEEIKDEEPAEEEVKTEEPIEEIKAEEPKTEATAEENVKAEEPVAEEVKSEEKPKEEAIEKPQTPAGEIRKFAEPSADFDWESIDKKDTTYSAAKREELEKLYDETLSSIIEGEVINGTIVAMNKREVVVNIGYKSEGVLNANEFRYEPDLKVGDTVEIFVENIDSGDGQLVVSHKKAKSLKAWERINEVFEKDEIIKGYIKCRTKGGMIVDVFGIEAFLPGSQIDVKPIRDYDIYVDKTMEFKVVKINEEFKNVVVSHKALIEAELEEQKKEIIAGLEKGQVLEGVVKNITSYGVFIDLGGVDGLIHITDLSWGRVNHPEEIVTLDETINVVILDFDDDKKRIALGYKQLTPHPWDSLDENLKVGDKVKGKVVVLADYGAFIEIKPGVEGLIHVSEMSWSQHLRSAQDFMKVGDEVEAVILTLDREERKMSLGIKQLSPDPWVEIEKRYPLSSKHTAKVRNFTNFGVFVELEEGVDGLVHISDLSWTKKIKHPAEFTSIDANLEVVVLEIDEENRRLSLGHKQIEENPWDVFETIFTIDSIHEGTIVEVNEKGSIISLPYGVEGFATPKHLVREDGAPAKLEEKLNFKVIEFNKDSKKIFVSHSRIHEDVERAKNVEDKKAKQAEAKSTSRKTKRIADKIEKTTLADVTDLAAIKKEIEEQVNAEKQEKAKKFKEEKAAQAKEDEKAAKKAVKKEDAEEKEVKEEAPKVEEVKEEKAKVKEEKPVEEAEEKPKRKTTKKAKEEIEDNETEAEAKPKKAATKKKKTEEKSDDEEKAE